MDPAADNIPPAMVPLSARAGNTISRQTDGLYVGRVLRLAVAYVSTSTGTDTATSGTLAQPFKTIDYALQNLFGGTTLNGDLTLLLKAGETFPLTTRYKAVGSNIIFAWYGDAQYGTYPGTAVLPSGADPSVMEDLVRPIITPTSSLTGTQWVLGGIDLQGVAANSISLPGVNMTLPVIPTANPTNDAYSIRSDFVLWDAHSSGVLSLFGTIVNKLDGSLFGLCGAHARANRPTLSQYASQFQVGGTLVNSTSATVAQLTARQWFIKMYADFVGNNQQSTSPDPTAQNSSPGSSILELLWSEVQAFTVTGSRKNLATFPLRNNTAYGVRNYFKGLVRDQQQRPFNVQAGFLF